MATKYAHTRRPLPTNLHPIVRTVFRLKHEQRVAWRDVEAKSGVGWNTICQWRTRAADPSLTRIEAVLNTLGYDLAAVPRGTTPKGD